MTSCTLPWDEALEQEHVVDVPLEGSSVTIVEVPGGTEVEERRPVGRLVRVREPVQRRLWCPLSSGRCRRTRSLLVSLRVENRTAAVEDPGPDRPVWLRRALVACHLLVEVDGAAFVSQLDPPEWAKGYVAAARTRGLSRCWPGRPSSRRVVLSSPIILYDHPELAPQSESSFMDSLEIDELLSLRTMTLSEEEKREVRGTDPRAAALLDEVDEMPAELWDRLHGTVRYLDAMTAPVPGLAPPPVPLGTP